LCNTAFDVTVNGVPAGVVPGVVSETPFTLISDVVVIFVVLLLLELLFALVGSLTCNWSTATEAVTEKLWLDGLLQVTDHVAGTSGTTVAVETSSDVSCCVNGFADEVEQSAGRLRANVVSAFVGP